MKMISRSIVLIFVTAVSALAQVQLTASQQAWVEETLAKMSVDEKIGQLLFPVATATFTNQESEAFQEIKQNIQTYHAGGLHMQGGNPVTASLLINRMQQLTKVPLLITADFEGGPGSQVQGATRFPRAMAIGATGNPQYAYDAASFTAKEAKAMGYSVNFYPVVDVNNNPQNPISNVRAFGENPQSVAECGAAYIKGTQDNGVIAPRNTFRAGDDRRFASRTAGHQLTAPLGPD
jgi:beta-glucosidase-like glycosyl hydrolase